jgi:hypothetical protein
VWGVSLVLVSICSWPVGLFVVIGAITLMGKGVIMQPGKGVGFF